MKYFTTGRRDADRRAYLTAAVASVREQIDGDRQGATMDAKDKHDEIAGLRQELADLEAAVALQPPLGPHTMDIALAKIAKLRQRIKELER